MSYHTTWHCEDVGTPFYRVTSPEFENPALAFTVDGASVSQGSLTAVPTNRNWKTVPGVRWTVKDAKAHLKPWRDKIADAARKARRDAELLEGPVAVTALFVFERPKAHYLRDAIRKDAPFFVTSHQKGDIDKHLRSVLDALTGVLYKDDSQVSSAQAHKVYGSQSFTWIGVTPCIHREEILRST